MVAPIRLDFASNTAKARAEINALSATVEKLQAKLIATTGMDNTLPQMLGVGAPMTTATKNLAQASGILQNFGGRTVDLSGPVKQTEKLVDNINKGKITLDEYRTASAKASRVVAQQLALQRAQINNIRQEGGKILGDFAYGEVHKGITPLQRLAVQAQVSGKALEAVGQHYIDMGKNMAFSARQLTISLTAPFVVTSALSMKAYMDSAEALTDIAKLYGDSSDGFKRSSDQIKQEARDLARSMSDTYAAAYQDTYEHQKFYAAQGLTGADLSGSTQQAIRLQMLGDVDTEDAQQAITTLTNVFGVQTEQMGQYVDYMNKIEDSTTLTMQDFSAAMPKIGPIIKSFEEDPKEATKAMAEMLEAGKRGGIQSATEIANAWKSIYTKVARPTEQLKSTWDELGSKNGVADSFMGIVTRNGGDVMAIVKEISTLTEDWSDVDKGRLFSQLAGAQQVARMTTFAQQLANSNETIKEINDQFDNSPRDLAENSRRQEDEIMASPEKRWAQFLNKLRDTGVTIGEKVFNPIMTVLEHAASFVERLVEGLDKIPGPLKGVLSIFGGFAVVLGPLVGVLGALIQVGGQMSKLWGTGKAGIGGALNKMTSGFTNKNLLTPDDRIADLTESGNFQFRAEVAYQEMMLGMQESTNSVTGSLSQFETQLKKTTQAMINDPNNSVVSSRSRLRPEDVERRSKILRAGALGSTGEAMPIMKEVYVPPKPPKGRRSHEHIEMQQYKQAVERSKEAKRIHDAEMQAFRERQADAKRIAARYKSFTDYLKDTPQEKLDSNYNKFKATPERAAEIQKNVRDTNAMNTEGMRRIAAMTNQGVARPDGGAIGTARKSNVQFSAMHAQTVRDQIGYVNRDLAMANNIPAKNAEKQAAKEKEIARLKSEQVRLNQVLKGSTAEIAEESERIKQSTQASLGKGGIPKFRNIKDSMRAGSDQIMTAGGEDILTGEPLLGSRVGLTKSGAYQASNRHVRRAVRRTLRENPKAFDKYRGPDQDYIETQIPMKGGGNLHMTPEIWKSVDVQMSKAQKSQERLAATQAKITENSKQYASNISNAVTGVGALAMMFGGDSGLVQGIGTATTAFGVAMSIMPETAGKLFEKTAIYGTQVFSKMGDFVGRTLSEGAGGFAADLVGGIQGKFLGLSRWFSANIGAIMGWGAAIGAAVGIATLAYQKLKKKSDEYRESLKAEIGLAKELSDALGYHHIDPRPRQENGSSITDQDREAADALSEIEGMQKTIDSLRGRNIRNTGDLEEMKLSLTPAAIKILGTGGTEADVSKMVRAALIAAGADEATIDGFKLNINVDDPDVVLPYKAFNEAVEGMTKERTGFDRFFAKTGMQFKALVSGEWGADEGLRILDASNYMATSEEEGKKIANQLKESVAAASAEARPEIAEHFTKLFEVPEDADQATKERINRTKDWFLSEFAAMDADWNNDEARQLMWGSESITNAMIAGPDHMKSGEEAAKGYQSAIAELEKSGYKLTDAQKLLINNLFRSSAGMKELGDEALGSEQKLNDFSQEAGKSQGPPKSLLQIMKGIQEFGYVVDEESERSVQAGRRIDSFTAALNRVPESFNRRWHFQVDMTSPDEVAKELAGIMEKGSDKSNDWGLGFAAKEMDRQHAQTVEGIKNAGDASLKALEGQQKAAEKAMKAQEKALDAKHKAQTKALDNQQKEENKRFDKQQKEEKKAFDKQQKADKKAFDKDIERQKKEFDDAWKQREDSLATYYEASRKYLEDQQAAEDKLDKSRERHAQAEAKRMEMLNDLANKGVDINVAIAGGNLDEAAKLMNEANAASQQYYSDAGQSIADAESEDRAGARQVRIDALSKAEQSGSDFLGKEREKATETFNLGIEGQQEAFGEKQEGESETFADRLERQKEEFQLQLEARREQLQLQQEQEKEFLALQREAEAEYFANKRAEIQATTDASIKGAEQAHEATKERMQLELEFLKLGSAATEEEVRKNADRLLGVYQKYGIDLGIAGEKLQDGMIEHYHAGVDQATEDIRKNEKWREVGNDIGTLIAVGINAGLDLEPGDIMQMYLQGKMSPELKNAYDKQNFQAISQGNRPVGQKPVRRAKGGPISGPGSGTSDSILARLSNGEHVLTAAEVRALGGHAAVERFRKQVAGGKMPAFAAGGPVGSGATGGLSSGAGLTVTVAPTGVGGAAEGGVLSAVAKDVQSIGTQFDKALTQTAAPAWKLFGDQLIQVKNNAINPTFDAMQVAMSNVALQTTNTTAGTMTPAWYLFGQDLMTVKEQMFDFAIESMQSGMTSLATGTTDAIANQIIPAWTSGANHIQDMQRNVIDPMMRATQDATTRTAENFGTAADMIGTGWAKVKENTAAPVRFTIGTVFNDGLVGMWNNVAEALDLETMNKHEFSFATGGVMPGYTPGTDVHHFTSPTGGKLHLSGGEAIMRPEWTRAVGGPSAVAQMNSAAKAGKLQGGRPVVPGLGFADGPGPVQKFADGGVIDGGKKKKADSGPKWDYTKGPNPAVKGGIDQTVHNGSRMTTPIQFAMWDAVRAAFPGVQLFSATRSFMTEGHPDNHNGGTALDLSPSHAVAQWIYKNYRAGMKELIFMPATGHSNVLGGQDAVWTQNNHYDHVHWAQGSMVNPWSGGVVSGGDLGGWGSAGGGGLSALALQVLDDWNTAKSDLEEKVEKFTADSKSGIANAIPEAMMGKIVEGMEQSFMSKLPTGSAGNTPIDWSGLPADIKSNIELGKFAAEKAGWTGAEWEALKTLWHNESGWDNNAQNPTSTAYGIAQFLDSTWAGFGPKTSDPKKQIEYGIQYIKSRPDYGGPVNGTPSRALAMWQSRSPHWYDQGGIANGKGAMMKNTIEPERVLSPEQTKTFGTMVEVLDRSFGSRSNVRKDTVSSPLSAMDYTRKVTDLDRQKYAGLKISEKEYNPKTQEEIAKSLQPIFNAFQSFIQRDVVPGIVGYATDLIQMKTDEERLTKVSSDIINGIENIYIPSNNEVIMVFGGTVYGDGHLVQIMEDYKRQILSEVRAISDEAARRVAGK